MSVITEYYRTREDGVRLVRIYSDRGMMIHGGFPEGDYAESVDPEDSGRTYTETETPVPEDELTDTEALNIIMGRDADEPGNSNEVPQTD